MFLHLVDDVVDQGAVRLVRVLVVDHVAVGDMVLLEVRGEDAPESTHASGLFHRSELLDRPVRLLETQAVVSQMDVAPDRLVDLLEPRMLGRNLCTAEVVPLAEQVAELLAVQC